MNAYDYIALLLVSILLLINTVSNVRYVQTKREIEKMLKDMEAIFDEHWKHL